MHSAFFASPFDLWHGQLSFVDSDFVCAVAPYKYSRDEIACSSACRIASLSSSAANSELLCITQPRALSRSMSCRVCGLHSR